MDEMHETPRLDLLNNFVTVEDMFDIDDNIKVFVESNYGDNRLDSMDVQTVAAGNVIDQARVTGILYRFFTVKMLIDKMPDFGDADEYEDAYLTIYKSTLETFKQGFTYNIAKGVDEDFYNDEMKKMLF